MQIKSIKLVGFKSFVDPTLIDVGRGMNGVVGPNGCGKSNIIDAVRWVIGERSAKQLRGQSMSDIIFNGTSNRKPLGRASVELIFDNSDASLVGEYASFAEIGIKREVSRDGQSHYYLNGTLCRRQDIVDIFYGTGLGPRSYAIIEQGMISRLIEAKPEDLRMHIEEAAGIGKYKQRRQDTENRMKHTVENLARLMDIRHELDKQLKHLERQAAAAKRYQLLREEEHQLNGQIKALHWQSWERALVDHRQKMVGSQHECERVATLLQTVDTKIEALRLAHTDALDQEHQLQKEFYGVQSQISILEQQIQHDQYQRQRAEEELKAVHTRLDILQEATAEYEIKINEITSQLNSLRPMSHSLLHDHETATLSLNHAEKTMQAWNDSWDTYQAQLAKHHQLLEVAKTKALHNREEQHRLEQRMVRLKESPSTETHTQIQSLISPLEMALTTLTEKRDARYGELNHIASSIQQKKQEIETLQKTMNDTRSRIQTERGRQASLEALQEAVFQVRVLPDYPRLGKHLDVKEGFEIAVETVLKGWIDAVCMDNLNTMTQDATLHSSDVVFIEKYNATSPHSDVPWVSLEKMVQSDWPVCVWLQNIFVMDSLEEALELREQLGSHQSFITRDGTWIGKYWIRFHKNHQEKDSVLRRDREIKLLSKSLVELEAHLN